MVNIDKIRFTLPTKWIHGKNAIYEIDNEIDNFNVKSIGIITDKNIIKNDIHKKLINQLNGKYHYTIYDNVVGEPTVSSITELAMNKEIFNNDLYIAIGGGSVIDTAKSIRLWDSFGGPITKFKGFDKIKSSLNKPLITIPTTSGSGSEISDGAVIIDDKKGTKFAIGGLFNCPTLAITDPYLTVSSPKMVTAITGTDALVHAIESYVTKSANTITEMFAMKAIEFLGSNLIKVIENGNDIGAREYMQIGATMAMISTFNSRLGLCHALAMPLCGKYSIPHGQACGIVLPDVLRFNYYARKTKIEALLSMIIDPGIENENDVMKTIDKLDEILKSIGIKRKLTEFGYKNEDKKDIVMKTMESFQTKNNPRQVTELDLYQIIENIK